MNDDTKRAPGKVTRRTILEYWWTIPVAAAAGFFAWFGLRSYGILFGKRDPAAPKFQSGSRTRVSATADLRQVWDAKAFEFEQTLGSSAVKTPCLLVRTKAPQVGGLSVGDAHFLGLSRICTHLQCVCEYIVDPEVASFAYKYRPEYKHPVLGCACHYSAFDPELAGKSVAGPALNPLPRVQLEHKNGVIYAVGIESS